MTDQNTTDKTDLRPRRRPTVPAMAATVALGALLVAVGVGLGQLRSEPLPPVTPPMAPVAATGTPTPGPEAAGPSQAATAPPVTYGATGLAAGYAKQAGYGSMSEACKAGIEWTCDVSKVETAVNYDSATAKTRDVYVQSVPMDPNAVAAEFLNQSPAGITKITVKDASSFLIVDVGTATRDGGTE